MKSNVKNNLSEDLSGTGSWAFALGTSIGWGSLVVTSNTYLAQAGPAGSILGLVIGALIMLVISRNYAYLISCYPEAGGAYSFSRSVFGYDYGFLTAWFLALTYLAMLWANATSLPLFVRYFLGDVFMFGKMYRIFGYEVYIGEVLLSIAAIGIASLLCACFRKVSVRLMIGLVILFSAGIAVCFCGSAVRSGVSFAPAFIPGKGTIGQILKIAAISPWAFIGFESISHGAEEFSFAKRKVFRILVISVLTATLLYICVTLLSVTAYPDTYENWFAYIRDLGNLSGIEALPAFYAANHYLGRTGIVILTASLLALILTSLIGNITALSRLIYTLGRDGLMPARIAGIGKHGTPAKAIMLVAALSLPVPFLGRTAVGWIVDVTTLGATIIYGMVSAAAGKVAQLRNDRTEKHTGRLGLVLMVGIGLYLLIPNLFTTGSMEPESYFLFAVWALLGFVVFRYLLRSDRKNNFGHSIVVWIALLSLILFVSLVWMNQSILNATNAAIRAVEGIYAGADIPKAQTDLVSSQLAAIRSVSARSISIVVLVFGLSLSVLVNNYRLMSRQAESSRKELDQVRDLAERDSLTGVRSKLAYSGKEAELDEKIAAGEEEPFALAVLDVNGLKQINDTLGHQAGDEYIQKASRMICLYFANSPVYRIGGDEFVVLMQDRDFENRADLLELFRKESQAHIAAKDVVIAVGCADFDKDMDKKTRDVFERADAQMYEHKKLLKNMGAAARL